MNEPIAADLINTFHRTFHSAKEGNLQPTRRSTVCEPSEDSLARTNTSEKANTPTMTGISPMPALSSKESNVNRKSPVLGSEPTMDRTSPTAPAKRLMIIPPWHTPQTNTSE